MRWWGVPLLVAVLALSGCLFASEDPASPSTSDPAPQGNGTALPQDWAEHLIPEGPDHAHPDPLQHRNLTTPNFEVLGWDPMVTDRYNATASPAYCGALTSQGERDYLAVTGGTSDVAITIVDVTDPGNPRVVGELVLPRSPVFDVDFVDGTPYVAVATFRAELNGGNASGIREGATAPRPGTVQPLWRDACGNTYEGPATPLPKAAGVVLVDLSDVTEPTVEDHVPQPVAGPHNVFADTVDGEPMILSSVTNFAHAASYFNFYRVSQTSPLGAELVDVGTWSSQLSSRTKDPPPRPPAPTNIHVDGWIQQHPVTNETIAYLANWNGGIVILEYQGPHRLEKRAVWNDYQPGTPGRSFISLFTSKGQMTGQWHRARPIEGTWNGSHYTVIHQEVSDRPAGRPTGMVAILDTTDPGDPVPVARWTLPVDPNWTELKHYSPHYLTVQNRTIFVALGHGGLWALDASPEHWPRLPSAGAFVPARESPAPPPESVSNAYAPEPFLGDVQATENAILTFDDNGVYTVAFNRSAEVPHPEPWHEAPWQQIPSSRR